MLPKLWVLIKKNLLLRRRHYIVTALEIILPTFFAWILAVSKTKTGEPIDVSNNKTEAFNALNEKHLNHKLEYSVSCSKCVIAYSPKNDLTNRIVERLSDEFAWIQWKPYQNEEEIEKFLNTINFKNIRSGPSLIAAIVFENGFKGDGYTLSYKIRMVDKVDDTRLLFPWFQLPGPNLIHADSYADSGFSALQIGIDKILVRHVTNKDIIQNITLQPFPYPPYVSKIDLSLVYFIILPQLFVVGFIFMVPSIVRVVVSEKETGIRELLKLNGVPGWLQWLGWMINSMLILTISITIVVLLLFWTFSTESGAALIYGDPSVWWVMLFLFAMSASAFCFFVSSFFHRPTLAMTVGIILWFGSYYFLFVRIEKNYQSTSFMEKISVALIPNMALHLAVKVMCVFEGKAVGAQWSNIAEPISSVDPLSLAHVILMFLINTTMYMFLTVYIENVFPSEYGVRKPWYYIFQICFRSSNVNKTGPGSGDMMNDESNVPGFEPQPLDCVVGIDIKNIGKSFGRNKVAVAGVSAKMYNGEIFALLGHNGAGKTTTISMITGLFAPSEGTATINGYDITNELEKVRNSLGLCPQHNMLFDKLTVAEHLQFFGQLKGLSHFQATTEMKLLLQKLQLSEKENVLSVSLSGGQKRKLSLGIALIGGTKVVILDEPTSGMDPEARRAIWDLLLEMRGHRTILLTTHFMEEADVLGDRIGIMANGKLQCCGTPMFLKKFYGTGYTLKMSLAEKAQTNINEILLLVQNHVHNASIKAGHSSRKTELLINLPTETASTGVLSEMFSELSKGKGQLGILTVGLSLTTMDEVFLRVGEAFENHDLVGIKTGDGAVESTSNMSGKSKSDVKENVSDVKATSDANDVKVSDSDVKSKSDIKVNVPDAPDAQMTSRSYGAKSRGSKLALEQFMALIIKKILYSFRNRKLILAQLFIPILILAITIRASNSVFKAPDPPPPLTMSLDRYIKPVTLVSAQNESYESYLSSVIGKSIKPIRPGSTMKKVIIDIGKADIAAYRERYIVAAEFNLEKFNAMFNTIPSHAAPLAINIATNTLLKSLDPATKYKISVTNHPLQSKTDAFMEAAKPNPSFAQTVPQMFAVLLPIGLALLAASFIVFPIEEKLCQSKQLQMMTGVSPIVYWCSAFAWDFVCVFLVVCIMTLCFPIFQTHEVFTSYGGTGVAFLIMLTYGYSAISFSYLMSLYSQTVTGGFAFVTIIHVASGTVLCLIVNSMENIGFLTGAAKFRWAGRLFPTFGAAISTMRYSEIAATNGRCNILSQEAKNILCDLNRDPRFEPKFNIECCDNCKDFAQNAMKCFTSIPYITWDYTKPSINTVIVVAGVGQELFYMVLMAFVYQFLLLLLEYKIIQRFFTGLCRAEMSVFATNDVDEDVEAENQRVSQMLLTGTVRNDAVVVDNLCKSYGSFAAVRRICFGVHHGECFGLLGVNGAGKTTTFRMLTGDEIRSCGNAYALMYTLEKDRQEFLANIGYCPQFDGVIGVLTGREMLELFCRLRGVSGKQCHLEAEKWLIKLGLLESGNVQCQKYSGGMKRRLSVAMSMIGDPPLLLLDEPTSGVDPVSRRQFWEVLSSVRDSGQAIILTSHSMDECEALCARLGIMVNGQLQCLGGVQHLKNKFAQGYSLSLKLKPMVPVESPQLASLSADIQTKFNPCILKDKHQNVLQYQILNTAIPWEIMFKTMEDLKTNHGGIIEDYSVNETTLEEVFLSFARKQYGSRKADVSLCTRIVTCQFC